MTKVAVDLRSLHSTEYSGVESYTINVLERLLGSDHENSYTFFYNGFKKKQFDFLHYINAVYKQTRIPNRILNSAIKISGRPKLESLIGPCDVLFMPNWNVCAVEPKTKVILTVHDLSPVLMPEMFSVKARLWHSIINIKKLVTRADRILSVSDHTKQSLMEILKVPESKITVAKLGVDHELFNGTLNVDRLRLARNNYNLPGDFLLYIGTIEPRKNIHRIIEAFERIQSPVHLVIAGKWGWKYKSILHRIEQSPKRRHIQILGYVPESDKPLLLKLARALIWPSLYEGFGLPVLEAMSVGTPVLTSQVSSLPEVAEDSALMVNPYNVHDIAQGIEILLHNESLRLRFAQKGIEQSKHFSWNDTAQKLQQIINE